MTAQRLVAITVSDTRAFLCFAQRYVHLQWALPANRPCERARVPNFPKFQEAECVGRCSFAGKTDVEVVGFLSFEGESDRVELQARCSNTGRKIITDSMVKLLTLKKAEVIRMQKLSRHLQVSSLAF